MTRKNNSDLDSLLSSQSLLDIQSKLKTLSDEKREHFIFTLNELLNCYLLEDERALLLVTSCSQKDKDRISLFAINANEAETEELIDTLCVFRKLDFQTTRNSAN